MLTAKIIKSELPIIDLTLKIIEDNTGIVLQLDDYFTGIQKSKKGDYFNVMLTQQISESKEYDILDMFANKYNQIKIEPNGFKRVAIFPRINQINNIQ